MIADLSDTPVEEVLAVRYNAFCDLMWGKQPVPNELPLKPPAAQKQLLEH